MPTPLPLLALLAAPTPAVLDCQDPGEAPAGAPLTLECRVTPRDAAVVVVLHRRQGGGEAYQAEPTLRVAPGIFRVTLCGCSVEAGPMHFYFEAHDALAYEKIVARSGHFETPHLLTAIAPGPAGGTRRGRVAAAAVTSDDDDPLAPIRERQAAERRAADAALRRGQGSVFLGLGMGYGYGYYPDRRLDFRRDIEIGSNGGAAGSWLLMPTVGYQLTSRFALALELRWERIDSEGAGDARTGEPADRSWAVLGRASYALGRGRTQLVLSGSAGAGDGFRLVVPPVPEQGLRRNDSVKAGPFLLGPGIGVAFHFNPHVALVADARVLAGLPRVAAVVDVQGGLELAL
jgi:hypothetical protein